MDRVRAAELADKAFLDEIEASTSRTYQHTLRLHDEVTHQNKHVGEMEGHFTKTKDALTKETNSITEARKMGQGLCWMYGIIILEVLVMFLLLYIGLSH